MSPKSQTNYYNESEYSTCGLLAEQKQYYTCVDLRLLKHGELNLFGQF